jgi:hypothetical protein
MPSDKPTNRQSINTGLKFNLTTLALTELATVLDYKGKPSYELPSEASLPDERNTFYARFEAGNTEPCMRAPVVPDNCVITLAVANVSKTFKQINIHKAAGWISRTHVQNMRRSCADQLVSSLTFLISP